MSTFVMASAIFRYYPNLKKHRTYEWNTIIPTIKYTFTCSEQTVSFLDVQIYPPESRKLKTKLYKKPSDFMALLYFHSHHPLTCKEGIVHSQALLYNIIPVNFNEIPVNFKFLGPTKAIQWAENALKKVIQNIDQRVKHCKK